MAKKGTPEYDIWYIKYKERRAQIAQTKSPAAKTMRKLEKESKAKTVDVNILTLYAHLKDQISEDNQETLDRLYTEYTEEERKTAELKLSNFLKVLRHSDQYPTHIVHKYSEEAFKETYDVPYKNVAVIESFVDY